MSVTFNISCACIFSVLVIIGKALIFGKMGVAEWKALIPVYSTYLLFEKVWNKNWFWMEMAAVLVGAATAVAGFMFLPSVELRVVGLVLLFVSFVLNATSVCVSLGVEYKLAKAFGHGFGYACGLVFLGGIFYPVLGVGKDQYQAA